MFTNETPLASDVSVYLTDVTVLTERDCGVGAECNEPLAPYTEYTCTCDDEHTGQVSTRGLSLTSAICDGLRMAACTLG